MKAPVYYTLEEVGEMFGNLDRAAVMRKCSHPLNPWPHIRPNQRDASTWRFTEADIAEIEHRIHVRAGAVDAWGRTQVKAS